MDDLFEIPASGDGVVVRVHVQPSAGRTAVMGRHGGALKVKVGAPPAQGRANEACAKLLADVLGVKAGTVTLASGASSRSKRFAVAGIDPADASRRLAAALEGEPPETSRGAR